MTQHAPTPDLFGSSSIWPQGLVYQDEFLSAPEEASLLQHIASLPLHEAQYKEYTAKRRIASFGSSYDFGDNTLRDEPPVPEFLLSLRDRAGTFAASHGARLGIPPGVAFVQALVTEYR